jgi:hypothetical protein
MPLVACEDVRTPLGTFRVVFGIGHLIISRGPVLTNPTTYAASGDAATPPSSVMNWRRPVSSMGSPPEPAVPAYRRLRMPRKRPQVLGLDLNRSERAGTRAAVPAADGTPSTPNAYRQKSLNRSGASSVYRTVC